jgi:hypothetical protein
MKIKVIDNWQNSWKWASIQLAALAGILAGILSANPGLLLGLISHLPTGPWRTLTAIGVAVIVFVIPTLARLIEKCRAEKVSE